MPELPEVETSRRGISPHIIGQQIEAIVIRQRRLRWPISTDIDTHLPGATVTSVDRRAKYLLINTTTGTAIIHLGMSGSVFIVDIDTPAGVHDHFDIEFGSGKALRFRDPRKFGSLHWTVIRENSDRCTGRTIWPATGCSEISGPNRWATIFRASTSGPSHVNEESLLNNSS